MYKLLAYALTLVLSFSTSLSGPVDAAPLKLSDLELDRVSAGRVELTVNAFSFATGAQVVNLALTDVRVRELGNSGKTIAIGNALAFAQGDEVFTVVGFELDTDERILSIRVAETHRSTNANGRAQRRGNHRRGNQRRGNSRGNRIQRRYGGRYNLSTAIGNVSELRTLRVRVVTVNK